MLEGFTEVDGTQHVFLNVPLFEAADIIDLPSLCIPFGSATGVCLYTPQSPEDAFYLATEDSGGDLTRRGELVARAPDRNRKYWITCDASQTPIYVQTYPSPDAIKKSTKYNVPIIKPGLEPCQSSPDCPENNWIVTHVAKQDVVGDWASN